MEAGRALIACRIVDDDDWCHRCGCQGRPGTPRPGAQPSRRCCATWKTPALTARPSTTSSSTSWTGWPATGLTMSPSISASTTSASASSPPARTSTRHRAACCCTASQARSLSSTRSTCRTRSRRAWVREGSERWLYRSRTLGYRNTTVDTEGGQAHIAALDTERSRPGQLGVHCLRHRRLHPQVAGRRAE